MSEKCLIGAHLKMAEPAPLNAQPDDKGVTDRHQNPDSISDYDKERLRAWNQDIPTLVDSLIHAQIEIQAEHRPRSAAVCAWDVVLTYEELNRRANMLARSLTIAGVQVGDYVPLLFEKSKWYIVAILAVSCSISASLMRMR